jgi:hypothetical protein
MKMSLKKLMKHTEEEIDNLSGNDELSNKSKSSINFYEFNSFNIINTIQLNVEI